MVFDFRDLLEEWKMTLIILMAKRPDASNIGYFRPISLCNTLYKVYARVLVEWLKLMVRCLINPEYDAFVIGHYIIDNILLA